MVKNSVRDVIGFVCSLERGRVGRLGSRRKRIEDDMTKVGPVKHIPLSIVCCLLDGGHVMRKAIYCLDHALVGDI